MGIGSTTLSSSWLASCPPSPAMTIACLVPSGCLASPAASTRLAGWSWSVSAICWSDIADGGQAPDVPATWERTAAKHGRRRPKPSPTTCVHGTIHFIGLTGTAGFLDERRVFLHETAQGSSPNPSVFGSCVVGSAFRCVRVLLRFCTGGSMDSILAICRALHLIESKPTKRVMCGTWPF